MPKIITLKQATESIPDASAEWLRANQKFYQGDHWQDGAGWSGPMPEPEHPLFRDLLLEIRRGFVSKNTVSEVVKRHVAGVLGREPAWSLALRRPLAEEETPTAEEQALIDEAETLLTEWWDDNRRGVSWYEDGTKGIHGLLQDAVATCLWARRGALRLFIPPGLLVDGMVPSSDLQTSVMKIYLHHPNSTQAAVFLDRDTMQTTGVYLYERDKKQFAEVTYLDEAGNTVIQIVGVDTETGQITTLPMSSLMMHQLSRERLISDQVVQNQKTVNLALTMLTRNVVMAGFLERTYLNAQLPGHLEDDPYRPGEQKFVPDPLNVGAGATNFISGVVTGTDAEGNEIVATPTLIYRDPVPVTTFRETKAEAYKTILEETQQLHALISGDAAASGESRKQALTDFKESLGDTKAEVESAIRWLLETVLNLAAVLSGQAGRYATLRAVAECRLDLGPISADDQRVAMELVEKEIISRETARGRVGIDDVDAEAAKIEAEQEASSRRTQTTLATAVLNAQRSLAGGQASNGLEQGSTGGTENAREGEAAQAANESD